MPSLAEDAGQLLVAGFDGPTLPEHVADALAAQRLGGAILFSRNVDTPAQVAELNAAVYAAAARGDAPLPFVAVDQEGGRVQRIREPATRWPPMALAGATRDADLIAKLGEAMGDELEALGFNVDFAPCVDVFTNPENTVIGDRAFGTEPAWVGRAGGALALGLTMAGLVPCAKHFPGHGDTALDSHLALPTIHHDVERLRATELAPFAALIRADIPMIMTAHVLIPAMDTVHPATLSQQIIGELLRKKMRFGGVVVSDCLEMKAVADRYGIEEMVTLGVRAGVDLFLICHTREKWERAHATLVKLGEASARDREAIAMAAGRVRWLKERYLRPWAPPEALDARLGTPAHRALAEQIVARASEAGAHDARGVDPTEPAT